MVFHGEQLLLPHLHIDSAQIERNNLDGPYNPIEKIDFSTVILMLSYM